MMSAPYAADRLAPDAWLVHAVGRSDLGIAGKDVDRDRAGSRARQLREAVTAQSASRALNLLLRAQYEDGVGARGAAVRTPLVKLLEGVGTLASPVRRLALVLVSAESAGHDPDHDIPATELGTLLRDALRLALPMLQQATGPVDVVDVRLLQPADLSEASMLRVLDPVVPPATPEDGRPVIVGWGSGASSTPLGVVSAAVQRRRPWFLLDCSGTSAVLGDPLELVPADVDPVVAHLIRLRLFHELRRVVDDGDVPPLSPEQSAALDAVIDLVDRGYRARNAACLALVAREALVRRDGTAGFALRRYVIAQHREMGGRPEEKCSEVHDPKGVPQLGHLIKAAERAVRRGSSDPRDKWMASPGVKLLNEIGNANHDLGLTGVKDAGIAAQLLDTWSPPTPEEVELGRVMGIASATGPSPRLLAVWPVGTPNAAAPPETIAQVLMSRGPGTAIERYLGVDENGLGAAESYPRGKAGPLQAVLIASDASKGAADEQVEELRLAAGGAVCDADLLVWNFPRPTTDQAQELTDALTASVARGDVGALFLVPTGPKTFVLAALQQLFALSARHAVPLFVRDMATSTNPSSGLHLWPTSLGHDRALLRAALTCYDRLELDTSARLLAATTRAEDLGLKCIDLAEEFTGRRDRPPAPGSLLERLSLVAYCAARTTQPQSSDLTRDPDALLSRFLILAATLVENRSDLWGEAPHSRSKPPLDLAADDVHNPRRSHAHTLRMLRRARNKLPLTHSKAKDAESAVRITAEKFTLNSRAEYGSPWPSDLTVLSLLRAAPAAAEAYDPRTADDRSSLPKRYRALREQMAGALSEIPAQTP